MKLEFNNLLNEFFKKKPDNPGIFFLIAIIFFGSILVLITPFGAGFDEDTHLARIWEMSKGELIPNRYLSTGPNYPSVFYEISYRQDPNLNPISWSTLKDQLVKKIDWANFITHRTRSIYFPSLYLFQAFITGIFCRIFNFPVSVLYFVLRFSYLLEYAFLCYLAITIIPRGKWLLGFITIWPMSIIQASIISPDGISNGVGFVFFAWVLFLISLQKQGSKYSKILGIITGLLIFGICTIKLNCLPLLLLLLLVPKEIFTAKVKCILMGASLVVFFLAVFGWNFLVSGNSSVIGSNVTSPLQKISDFVLNPISLFQAIIKDVEQNGSRYVYELIGVSGYDYWKLPNFMYILMPICLTFVALFEPVQTPLTSKQRVGLLIISIFVFLFTSLVFYLVYSDPGSQTINGIQGRYFIVALPLIFFCLQRMSTTTKQYFLLTKFLIVSSVFFTIIILFFDYHVICGNSMFTSPKCYLPRYKNWDPGIFVKMDAEKMAGAVQTFVPLCNPDQIGFWLSGEGELTGVINVIQAETNKIEGVLNLDRIQNENGWSFFDLRDVNLEKNTQYLIDIKTIKVSVTTPVFFYYSKTNEYSGGAFYSKGHLQDGDLVFQYGCSSGRK